MKEIKIFLSYCWDDKEVADRIFSDMKNSQNIELHRDVIDIKTWGSIKEYMHSISEMDYTILLVSDAYLKSSNCMYEVLEVMRDRQYRDRIFPAVINSSVYKPISRAGYVKYWENQFKELDQELKGISVQNLGKLNMDLKRYQDISSNIATFLDVVSDMNNPNVADVSSRVEEKLRSWSGHKDNEKVDESDLFETLSIRKEKAISEPTDLDVNQFIKESFNQIIKLLSQLCLQYQNEYSGIQVETEKIDTRTVTYQFYSNGQLVRGIKLFLGNILGRQENIGISDYTIPFANNSSWNGMYNAKFIDGRLQLYAAMSMVNNQKGMTVEAVVSDIWENYIQVYLVR